MASRSKVGFFSNKWWGFSLPNHSLGCNELCEVVQYYFEKVLIVFLESIQETSRWTQYFMEFWSKFYRNEQKGPKGSLFSMVASYCRCRGACKKRVKIPPRLRESHGRAKSSVLPLDLRPRLALGKNVGVFSKKWQGFSLQKHSLGSNKLCEMIQYHFQKVFLVFMEFIYETGRRTRFCVEYLSKFGRNEQNALKGPLFSPVHHIANAEWVQKIESKLQRILVPWKGQKWCAFTFGFGRTTLGRKVGFFFFLAKIYEVFPCKTFFGS